MRIYFTWSAVKWTEHCNPSLGIMYLSLFIELYNLLKNSLYMVRHWTCVGKNKYKSNSLHEIHPQIKATTILKCLSPSSVSVLQGSQSFKGLSPSSVSVLQIVLQHWVDMDTKYNCLAKIKYNSGYCWLNVIIYE